MTEIETCKDQIHALLVRLGLPLASSSDETESDAEFLELELALGFPNLTKEERELIAACNFAKRAVVLGQATLQNADLDEIQRVETELQVRISETHYLEARYRMEQYGIRAKLSDFQEDILGDFAVVEIGRD